MSNEALFNQAAGTIVLPQQVARLVVDEQGDGIDGVIDSALFDPLFQSVVKIGRGDARARDADESPTVVVAEGQRGGAVGWGGCPVLRRSIPVGVVAPAQPVAGRSSIEVVLGRMSGSRTLLERLEAAVPWEQHDRRLFDQTFREPRLTAAYPHSGNRVSINFQSSEQSR